MNENCILIDWFSATTCDFDPVGLIDWLGLNLDDFEHLHGFYFYNDRLWFNGISIHYGRRDDVSGEILLEMSGQGCRQLETSSNKCFDQLFQLVLDGTFHVTRLDVAYDDISHDDKYLLDIKKIADYTLKQYFVTRWGKGSVTDSFKINGNSEPMVHALTVEFGSNSSEMKLRIYDKAQERGGLDYHWVRAELVLRRDRAAGFIKKYMATHKIGEIYSGVMRNYLRFIVNDATRRERCSTVGWWDKWLDDVEKISLYVKKDVEYNLPRLEHYIVHQCGNSIDTFIQCVGLDAALEAINKRDSRLNSNQQRLISLCKFDDDSLF